MKGYVSSYGYMGLIDGRYMLFSCESDYVEFYQERNDAT